MVGILLGKGDRWPSDEVDLLGHFCYLGIEEFGSILNENKRILSYEAFAVGSHQNCQIR